MGYAPIDFLKRSDATVDDFIDDLVKAGVESFRGISQDEYIRAFQSRKLMNDEPDWKHFDLTKVLAENTDMMLARMGVKESDVKNGIVDLRTEWKDIYLAIAIWEKWSKNKQVYQPDPYFTEALLHTRGLELTKDMIAHLPISTFYIDFTNVPLFEPIIGAVIDVRVDGDILNITEYLLAENNTYFSFYTGGTFDENGCIKIDIDKTFPKENRKEYLSFDNELKGRRVREVMKSVIDRTTVSMFGAQMIQYLVSKEPDIEENPITKSTYKPSKVVRNKFSEVQKWDVGIRFGKSIQSKLTEAENQNKNKDQKSGPETRKEEVKSRKSPVPHFRCAHWHHYWTGIGRNNYEVRWIEPTFVGWKVPDEVETATNVVIHKVK